MLTAPTAQGLYDPQFEHDACGVGFIAHVKGKKSHAIVRDALTALVNLNHRGACGCEANTGDGAGILMQAPHEFLKTAAGCEKISLPGAGELATQANRTQPGQAFTAANSGTFGKVASTVGTTVGLGTSRQVQFALRFSF
jgi:glutamate synthase (ferredoxin)